MPQTKTKLNPIPLSMRGKKRYILLSLKTQETLEEKSVKRAILQAFEKLFGVSGLAKQKLWFINFNEKNNAAILRCSLETLEEVKAGLLFIQAVHHVPVIPVIRLVSGSLKKAKESSTRGL